MPPTNVGTSTLVTCIANAWSGRVEGGYRFVSPWMGGIGITPYAAGQFTTFDLPAYAEQAVVGTNTFALAYGSKNVTASRSELGLRSDKSFAMQDGIFTLRGRAEWAHDFNTDRVIGATFQTLPGASFVVNGAAQSPEFVDTHLCEIILILHISSPSLASNKARDKCGKNDG
jgi:uncharacterized protein with beta-barrel porin domain